MTTLQKGLLAGAVQVTLLCGIAGKFAYERQAYPRAWMKTAPIDPNLPFRGRYVSLRALAGRGNPEPGANYSRVRLYVENGRVLAAKTEGRGENASALPGLDIQSLEPLAFFIPEHAEDPSRLKPGEELWVEVTVPPTGPPRPIRLEKRLKQQ